MKDLLKLFESLAGMADVFKPRKSIVEQKARKRKLKNDLREKKFKKRMQRIQKKIDNRNQN